MLMLTLALFTHAAYPSAASRNWALLAGALGGTALAIFYRALAGGNMGITAPVAAVLGAAIPAAFAMITQGLPGTFRHRRLPAGRSRHLADLPSRRLGQQLLRVFDGRAGRSRICRIFYLHRSRRRQFRLVVGGAFARRLSGSRGSHRLVPARPTARLAARRRGARALRRMSGRHAAPRSSSAPNRPAGWIPRSC